jgi:hypothetical protein
MPEQSSRRRPARLTKRRPLLARLRHRLSTQYLQPTTSTHTEPLLCVLAAALIAITTVLVFVAGTTDHQLVAETARVTATSAAGSLTLHALGRLTGRVVVRIQQYRRQPPLAR